MKDNKENNHEWEELIRSNW